MTCHTDQIRKYMPYKDASKKRIFQLKWIRERKAKWISENGPCSKCGGTERLEVDHVDRITKQTHRVWSWTESRRLEELAKCQVLCHVCHREKTNTENTKPIIHGSHLSRRKGCKCEPCRLAYNIHKNEYRYRTGQRTRPVSSVGRAPAL